jgi:hypothetical protein
MTLYESFIAARDAAWANQRIMDLWRLGTLAQTGRYIARVQHVTIPPPRRSA